MARKRERGQAFDYLIRNESSFFAPFSFNQRPAPIPLLPPVTIATLSASLPVIGVSFVVVYFSL